MRTTELCYIAYLGRYYIAINFLRKKTPVFGVYSMKLIKFFLVSILINYYGNHCESNVYALGSDSNSGVHSYTLTI